MGYINTDKEDQNDIQIQCVIVHLNYANAYNFALDVIRQHVFGAA